MENAELLEKKISILQEISDAIVVTNDIGVVATLMLDLAINYTNAEKGSLMLLNEQRELHILAARGLDIQFANTYRVKIGEGIAGTVAKNRLSVLVEDIEKDERFKGKTRDRYKTKSFISCPIVSKNRLLGVLNINDKKDCTPFTEDEFALLKIIANQAAIALENAFLMTQLRVKAADLEEINRNLIDTAVIKTEFLTRVSHELRTPLNSIKGAIYYLEQSEKPTKSQQKEFYGIISNETSKLSAIIENLLDFIRLEDEARLIKKTEINLSDHMKEIINSTALKTLLIRKNLKLEVDINESISNITGDKGKVIQFFICLIEGSSYYLESGDTISITINENEFVEVNLTLSRRLPEHLIPDLFSSKYMFQTDQSEEKLKLYLAWMVAKIHRWKLNAENKDDTFLISLTIPKSTREKTEAVINTTMEMFIEFISEVLDLNICSIMLIDDLTGELSIRSARGLDDEVIRLTRIKIGDSIAGWVALEGKPLLIENIETDPRLGRRSITQYSTKSLLSLPLKIHDKVIGVLNLNNKKTAESFTTQDLYLASVLGDRVSYFINRLYSNEYNGNDVKQFVTSFDSLLNAEKRYHKKNSGIRDLIIRIMNYFEANEEEKKLALYISMIYDLGLMLIDESVLKKKKFIPAEARTLKVHPYTTVGLLNSFEFSEDVKKAILHHHERYDGSGYPDGLKGEEIPFISRVLSVVDSFCAMITERPYRKAFTVEEALQEIKNGAGTIYDPKVVEALQGVL